jgi:hypothetical protein
VKYDGLPVIFAGYLPVSRHISRQDGKLNEGNINSLRAVLTTKSVGVGVADKCFILQIPNKFHVPILRQDTQHGKD